MRCRFGYICGAVFLLGAAGCVSVERTAPVSATAGHDREISPAVANAHPHNNKLLTMELRRMPFLDNTNYDAYSFSTPSSGKNGQPGNLVSGEYLKSREPGRKKLVIVIPIYGSSTIPPENLVRHLTEWNDAADTNVLLLNGEDDIFNWDAMTRSVTLQEFLDEIDLSAKRMRTIVADIRRLINWAEARPEIDPKRIGIAGFSIGATISSIVMGVDSRIATSVLAMGGGNLHEIFAHCASPDVMRAREHVAKTFGLSAEKTAVLLEPRLRPVNPVRFEYSIDPARILVIDSLYDDFIPRSAQDDLWRALGEPERISLKYAHKEAFLRSIIGFHYTDRISAEFFKKKL